MKIFAANEIRTIDQLTTTYRHITSLQLMENASVAFFQRFTKEFPDKSRKIAVCCGVGNNGGDGLVVARYLAKAGYDTEIFIIAFSKNHSADFSHNLKRAEKQKIKITFVSDENTMPSFSPFDIIIDAIFGTGLSREITGIAQSIIKQINLSEKIIVSIDVPSGLFLDKPTQFAIKSHLTTTFQIPKLAYFLPENQQYIGRVIIENIGLSEKAIAELPTHTFLTTRKDIAAKLRPLDTFTHKGTQGHALIIGGSKGKTGSIILSSKAALKSGCGLVTAFLPQCGTIPMQAAFPEAMVIEDAAHDMLTEIAFDIKPDAIGIGMGLGQNMKTQKALQQFLRTNEAPLVIDADALNILSQNKEWIQLLPPRTILTPHPKELTRLIGSWKNDFEKIDKTMYFATKHDLIIVLKGAYSMIFSDGNIHVNNSGTPALATAGSGDVLTGIITGMCAQGYSPLDATIIGVYTHGLTANITAKTINPRSFIASDIIENIGNAFTAIEKTTNTVSQNDRE